MEQSQSSLKLNEMISNFDGDSPGITTTFLLLAVFITFAMVSCVIEEVILYFSESHDVEIHSR